MTLEQLTHEVSELKKELAELKAKKKTFYDPVRLQEALHKAIHGRGRAANEDLRKYIQEGGRVEP